MVRSGQVSKRGRYINHLKVDETVEQKVIKQKSGSGTYKPGMGNLGTPHPFRRRLNDRITALARDFIDDMRSSFLRSQDQESELR